MNYELFGTKKALFGDIASEGAEDAEVKQKQDLFFQVKSTDYGEILGSRDFIKTALKKFERRQKPTDQSNGVQRIDDRYLEPVEKVVAEFEKMNGVKLMEIDTTSFEGKRLRGGLLIHLKDRAGLKYKEIAEMELFPGLKFTSLGGIYRNMKKAHLKKKE